MAVSQTKLCFDFTSETQHCSSCGSKLEQGQGRASQLFVLKDCRCVFSNISPSAKGVSNHEQIICGCCAGRRPGSSRNTARPCRWRNHAQLKRQQCRKIYNVDCLICLEPGQPNRVALLCGRVCSGFIE
jgi:ribosomal protein L24E